MGAIVAEWLYFLLMQSGKTDPELHIPGLGDSARGQSAERGKDITHITYIHPLLHAAALTLLGRWQIPDPPRCRCTRLSMGKSFLKSQDVLPIRTSILLIYFESTVTTKSAICGWEGQTWSFPMQEDVDLDCSCLTHMTVRIKVTGQWVSGRVSDTVTAILWSVNIYMSLFQTETPK